MPPMFLFVSANCGVLRIMSFDKSTTDLLAKIYWLCNDSFSLHFCIAIWLVSLITVWKCFIRESLKDKMQIGLSYHFITKILNTSNS